MSDSDAMGDRIAGLGYPSFYFTDLDAAVAFYEKAFGKADYMEGAGCIGIPLGDSWMTLFKAEQGPHPGSDPRSTEFAIRVKEPEDVDRLYARLIELGAKAMKGFAPTDTWMYKPMRFCCVDDPFGIRIDVYCLLPEPESKSDDSAAPATS